MKALRNFLAIMLISLALLGLMCSCGEDESSTHEPTASNSTNSSDFGDENDTPTVSSDKQEGDTDISNGTTDSDDSDTGESSDTSETEDSGDDLWTGNKK